MLLQLRQPARWPPFAAAHPSKRLLPTYPPRLQRKGQTVLVTAAAGGTGQLAVQLAVLAGCTVIGTCSGGSKAELLRCGLGAAGVPQGPCKLTTPAAAAPTAAHTPSCVCRVPARLPASRSLGCHRVISYREEDVKAVLRKEFPQGVDVVYESGGPGPRAGACGGLVHGLAAQRVWLRSSPAAPHTPLCPGAC